MTDMPRFSLPVRWWLLACVLAAAPVVFAQDASEATEQAPRSDKTEPPNDSAKDIAKNIVLDQKQMWTSPFRMTRQDAKWWLIFGAATGALIATDHRVSEQLPNTGKQVAFSRGVSRLGAAYTLIPIAGGLYLSGVLTRQSKLRDTGLLGGEALVDGLIVSQVLKAATGRQRPLEGDGGGHWYGLKASSRPVFPCWSVRLALARNSSKYMASACPCTYGPSHPVSCLAPPIQRLFPKVIGSVLMASFAADPA